MDDWPDKVREIEDASGKPVWVTEVGVSSFGAEEVQAWGLQRTAELLLPRVDRVYWYSLLDLPQAWGATTRHKESEKGLGLGLSIADRMARVLDHPIRVRSKEGCGTMFSVSVPVVAPRTATEQAEDASPKRAGNKLAGTRILCIDNESLILEGMKAMLSGWGCEVFTATTIGGAKSVLRHLDGDPDAILADYHLDNEVTGLMALEALGERLEGAVPGIVITADRTEEVAEEVRRAGYQLLLKPVRPAALRALLTRTLQASRAPSG